MYTVCAQKVVVKNGLEYLEGEEVVDDLNSIERSGEVMNVTIKKTNNKKVVTALIENINKVTKRKKRLRFRKKRKNTINKCYKEAINDCNSKEKKGK